MAVPPAYADLGKSAKDIFSKGFGKEADCQKCMWAKANSLDQVRTETIFSQTDRNHQEIDMVP